MDELKNTAEEIADHTGELIDTYYRLFVVNATDKGSKVASIGITAIVMGLISFTALLFAGVGLAIWIGEYMQNMKAGVKGEGSVDEIFSALCEEIEKRKAA